MHLYTSFAHPFKEIAFHIPTAHIVIDDTHFYTLLCFLYQFISHHITQCVIIKDITVDMDMMFSLADIPQQRMEEIITVGEDIHLIVLERQSPVLISEQFDKRLLLIRNLQVLLLSELQHRTLGQLVERTLGNKTFLARIPTEKEIKDETHHRQEYQHHDPCHRLCRLAVVHQHCYHRSQGDDNINGYDDDFNHGNPTNLWVCNDRRQWGCCLIYSTQASVISLFFCGSPTSQG